MGEDGFDWLGEDRSGDADETQTAEPDERLEGDPARGDGSDARRPRSAADPDADITDEGGAPDRSATAEGDAGCPHAFKGLVDRIEARADRIADVGDLRDLVPPAVREGDPADLDRLLERMDGEMGVARGASPLDVPAGGGRNEPVDGGTTHDEGSESTRDGPASADRAPGGTPDGEGGAGRGRSSGSGRSNPFENLATRVAADAERRSLGDRLGAAGPVDRSAIPSDATNVLLLSSFDTDDAFELCLSLIGERSPERTNLLFVWLTRDAGERIARLYESFVDSSVSVTVICRSEIEHLLRDNPSIPTDDSGGNLSIERISDPRDLPKLGIAINGVTSNWTGPRKPMMCFHSVTDLLQFEDRERVFRFLHVLGGRMSSVGARAYYHLDPGAHDAQTTAMFRNLFDATVDLTGGTTGGEG